MSKQYGFHYVFFVNLEYKSSKSSLTKSKEKVSADEAEEKLLQKEDEAKITTRVDMADAKYVVGDLRNGDAKVELDANKKVIQKMGKNILYTPLVWASRLKLEYPVIRTPVDI